MSQMILSAIPLTPLISPTIPVNMVGSLTVTTLSDEDLLDLWWHFTEAAEILDNAFAGLILQPQWLFQMDTYLEALDEEIVRRDLDNRLVEVRASHG